MRALARAAGTILRTLPLPWVVAKIAAVTAATCCGFTPTATCVSAIFPAGATFLGVEISPSAEGRVPKNLNAIPPSTKKTIAKAILV